MLRRVDYRIAINLFVFTGLWFVIGAIVLWSPAPGALGIGGGLFVMWLLMFFAVLAVAGSALTLAAINVAFPATRDFEPSELRTRVQSTAGRIRQSAPPPEPAPSVAPQSGVPSPPRTRTPGRAPLWAPSQTDAASPKNTAIPPTDALPQSRHTQRGDA